MYPALRQNGIARWFALILALLFFAAVLCLPLALTLAALKPK